MSFLEMMRDVLKSERPVLEGTGSVVHAEAIEGGKQFKGMISTAHLPTLAVEKSPLPVPPQNPTVQPGDWITWQGTSSKASEGVIDFLHSYLGEVWAFCTLPDGMWTAVNVKYVRKK